MIEITALASSSKGNCYRITDGHTPLLLECGIRYKDIQRALDFKMSSLAGCLITHEHKDHCASLKDMVNAGVDCFMSGGTAAAIGLEHHRIRTVKTKEQFTLGTWTIMPFDVQHDVSEPFGYLLANTAGDKLVFLTDTYYCKYRFNGLTHIMVEANFALDILDANIHRGSVPAVMRRRLIKSHFSLENVKEFLKANDLSKVQEIWLLHLSDGNSDEALFKREIQEISGKVVYIA